MLKSYFQGIGSVVLLTAECFYNDTMLNNESYRTGTADTPICDCGQAQETTEHFLLHCNRYEKERKDMVDFIYHSGIIAKQKESSIITE